MKNKLVKGLIIMSIVLVFSPLCVCRAASLYFSGLENEYQQGDIFSASVFVNPENIGVYTVKIELNYPSDLLQIRSFSFGGSWMPLSQAGYDLIDNAGGTLIKTAGYPGGTMSPILFGKAVFYVKKTGSGAIRLSSNSLVFNQDSQNILTGSLPKTELAFIPATIQPKPVVKPGEKVIENIKPIASEIPIADNQEPEQVIIKEELKVDSRMAWKYAQLAALSFGAYALDHRIIIYGGLLLLLFFILRIIIKFIISHTRKT